MRVTLVAAVDEDDLLGLDGRVPWHLPAELAHFRAVTLGRPVIVGRRTHEAIGRALPGRLNIVLSRREGLIAEGCVVAPDLPAALRVAEATGAAESAVIGGAAVFEEAGWIADGMILTRVHARIDTAGRGGVVRLPRAAWWGPRGAHIAREERHAADALNPYAWTVQSVVFRAPPRFFTRATLK